MAILVTGAAGFIGRRLVSHYQSCGQSILAFDFAEPPPEILAQWKGSAEFVRGDIRDRELVHRIVEESGEADPIIHLAGMLTAGCDRDPQSAMAINVSGTQHLLDAALKNGKRRIVVASTIGVYGRGLPQPITEDMRTEPDGWYGLTKLMIEQMGLLYVRRHGMDVRAARFAAVTGAGRSAGSGSASLFTSYIPEKAAKGEPYEIEVTADTAYPVVYIKDAIAALTTLATVPAATSPGRMGEQHAERATSRIYNFASGRIVVSDLVSTVKQQAPDATFTYKPDPTIMSVVSGYRDWRIDCTRAREELGWEPSFGVANMVEDIIRTARNTGD